MSDSSPNTFLPSSGTWSGIASPGPARLKDSLPLVQRPFPGPGSKALAERLAQSECPEVTWLSDDFPVFWEQAEDCMVQDVDGNRFLDFTAAFAVASVGHTHPDVVTAITAQAQKLLHGMGDVHPTALKVSLAERISGLTSGALGLPIFGTSGAEAVEALRKTVTIASGKPRMLAFTGAYHGLTYGALELTSRTDFRKPFSAQRSGTVSHVPYPNCYRCPYGQTYPACRFECLKAVERALDDPASGQDDIGGVLLEPIQGRGGTIVPPPEFLPGLRRICDERGILLALDEVFTGFGRTGRWFAHEHEGIRPDVMAVGKAMGGGMPISACIGKPEIMRRWPVSQGEAIHTSTFLGHPLSCAAALAALNVLERDELVARSHARGQYLMEGLRELQKRHPIIGDVRGRGLMVGVELVHDREKKTPATDVSVGLMRWALARGLVILPEGTAGNVLGIFPPLTIREAQLDWGLRLMDEGLRELTPA